MEIQISRQDLEALVFIAILIAMFTNFFGLVDLWDNRGTWYTVNQQELENMINKLEALGAFLDSDGIANEIIKIKAFNSDRRAGTVMYQVKVPTRVFKYQEAKLTHQNKLELLGLDSQ